ncbi:MAG: RHS repeat-associated core domain-containing protein, partial [Parachlamydiaceae bacterium]|nr:RHS repeat-associated core domain-containing protein [Parachlamydiaceae bacterium]
FTGFQGVKEYTIPCSLSETYCLSKETKSSGNTFQYHYMGIKHHGDYYRRARYDILTKVEVRSPNDTLTGIVNYVPLKRSDYTRFPHQDVVAGDGRSVRYYFEMLSRHDHRCENLLKKVERSDGPTETYHYIEGEKDVEMLVRRKNRPDGRFLNIKYYRKGGNIVGEDIVKISKKDDLIRNRVRAIQAPVGCDNTAINTYRFYYTINPLLHHEDKDAPRGGSTKVLDALSNKSIYTYGRDQRLKHIDRFASDGSLYSRESLLWSSLLSERSYLSARTLASESGALAFARTYSYDSAGNVLQDALYGNLSGHNTITPVILENGKAAENGCEFFRKELRYSENGANQLLWESDGFHESSFEYEKDANRLSAKFIGEPNKILLREFYEYNIEASITKKIIDDGSTKDRNNLTSVTQRHITYYYPRTTYPFGYPEVIIEKCLDIASGQEVLINKVVNTHNTQGLLVKQDHYDNSENYLYTLYWDYNAMGNLIREVNALQQISEWRYDPNGNCVYEQGFNPNEHKEFIYDLANRLVRQDEIHTDGTRRSISYCYNVLSQLVTLQDSFNNGTHYEYDAFGRVTHITYPTVADETGTYSSPTLTKTYNLMGNVASMTDSQGNKTEMSYTLRGQVAKTIYSDGSTESNIYSKDGLLLAACAKNGTKTAYSYDALRRIVKTEITTYSGELLSETSATYNGFHLTSETDAMGQVTFFNYYSNGALKSKQRAGSLTSLTYDAQGRLKTSIEHYGPNPDDVIVKTQEYDLLNRIIEERIEDSKGIFTKTNYTFDAAGQLIETRTGDGNTSTTVFDSYGTPSIITDGEGNQILTKRSFNYYNAVGQNVDFLEVTDALGNTAVSIFDTLGRVVSTTRKNSAGIILQQQDFVYDHNGNRCLLIDKIISGSSERSVVTKLVHDMLNRPIACYEAAGTPEQKYTQINYNAYGQKSSFVKADGTILYYTYDALGRLSSLYSSDHTIYYSYTYDQNNHPIKINDLINKTSTIKKYDQCGLLIEEILAHGFSLGFGYDAMGRPINVSLPNRTGIAFRYRGPFLEKIQRLSSQNTITYEHVYNRYDLSGCLMEASLIGRAGNLNYSYDKNDRLKQAHSVHWEETLTYDVVGNLTEERLRDFNGEVSLNYSYNDLYQLLSERGVTNHNYQYDSLYNRTAKDSNIHAHNDLNQMLSDGDAVYTYDLNGNMLNKASANETICFTYDALDRLTSLTNGLRQVRYFYDEANRRLSKSLYQRGTNDEWVFEKTIKYIYQDQNEIGSLNSNDEIVELRLLGIGRGAEIGAAIALEIDNKVFAPIHDHAGNVACLVEAETGLVFETYRYSSFGEELFNDSVSPWCFSSKRVDNESGLVYFGRRYYDPVVGRWISQDPLGREGGPNLYAYVLNNPQTNFDLYGLSTEGQSGGGFSGLLQSINEGIKYICDTWQTQCPIPILRDSLSAVHHFATNGNLNTFEMHHQGTQSTNGQIYGIEFLDDIVIGYLPGMNNTVESTIGGAQKISNLHANSSVYYSHCKDPGFIYDICRTIFQKIGFRSTPSTKAAEMIRGMLKKVGPNGRVLLYTFSKGGQTAADMKMFLTPAERSRIDVKTFGSAKMVSKKDFGSAENFISPTDAIPLVADGIGIIRSFFSDNISIEFLNTRSLPLIDHCIEGPTYMHGLKKCGQNIIDLQIKGN